VDIEALEVVEAGGRNWASSVAGELALALDDWALARARTRKKGDTTWKKQLDAAAGAHPDPWRCRLREHLPKWDKKALIALAQSPEMAVLPACTLNLFAETLRISGALEQAVVVLRKARQRYPGDFWIHFHLGRCMELLRPARWDEAVR